MATTAVSNDSSLEPTDFRRCPPSIAACRRTLHFFGFLVVLLVVGYIVSAIANASSDKLNIGQLEAYFEKTTDGTPKVFTVIPHTATETASIIFVQGYDGLKRTVWSAVDFPPGTKVYLQKVTYEGQYDSHEFAFPVHPEDWR